MVGDCRLTVEVVAGRHVVAAALKKRAADGALVESFWFAFRREERQYALLLTTLGRWAEDPEIDFAWRDAERLLAELRVHMLATADRPCDMPGGVNG